MAVCRFTRSLRKPLTKRFDEEAPKGFDEEAPKGFDEGFEEGFDEEVWRRSPPEVWRRSPEGYDETGAPKRPTEPKQAQTFDEARTTFDETHNKIDRRVWGRLTGMPQGMMKSMTKGFDEEVWRSVCFRRLLRYVKGVWRRWNKYLWRIPLTNTFDEGVWRRHEFLSTH